MIGPRPRARRELRDDPTGERYGIPTYTWRSVPAGAGIATRRQLRTMGLTPGRQPIAAQALRWRKRREPLCAYFYRVDLARPKRPASAAQLAAVAKATRTRQLRAALRHGVNLEDAA